MNADMQDSEWSCSRRADGSERAFLSEWIPLRFVGLRQAGETYGKHKRYSVAVLTAIIAIWAFFWAFLVSFVRPICGV